MSARSARAASGGASGDGAQGRVAVVLNPQDPDSPLSDDVGAGGGEVTDDAPDAVHRGVADNAEVVLASKHSTRRPSPVGGSSSPMWAAEGGPCREADGTSEFKEKTAAAGDAVFSDSKFECDACPHCDDLCVWAACEACGEKEKLVRERNGGMLFPPAPKARFTMCQVSKHTKPNDVWLVAHGQVYDATEFLSDHPGGPKSIMRHAGKDCSEDFDFHSCGAKKLWKDLHIGRLVLCPKEEGDQRCAIM